MKNQITRSLALAAVAVLTASAGAQLKNLGAKFTHIHKLCWGNTNFGSTFKLRADSIAASANAGWFANTAYSSVNAEYRARLLSSKEHNVVKGRVYALANANTTLGGTRLTIGSLDFVFWPQTGSYKSIGGYHSFNHSYGWKQWFGRLVQGSKYFAGILVKSRMSSTIEVKSKVTVRKHPKRAKVNLELVMHPWVTVQVVNNAAAYIQGHIRPLFPEDASLTLDSRQTRTYGRGIVDYNDYVSMVMWIKRLFQPKIMLASTGMVPRDSFPSSMYVGGKYYLGFRLF